MSNFGFSTDIFRNVQGTFPWLIIYFCILIYYIKNKKCLWIRVGIVLWYICFFNDFIGLFWGNIGSFRAGIYRFLWMMSMVMVIAVFIADNLWENRRNVFFRGILLGVFSFIVLFYSPDSFYKSFHSYGNIYQIDEDIINAADCIVDDASNGEPYVMGDYYFLESARSYNPAIKLMTTHFEVYKVTANKQLLDSSECFLIMVELCVGTEKYTWEQKQRVLKETDVEYLIVTKNEYTYTYQDNLQNELILIGENNRYYIYKVIGR